jgi:hypothetical protein
MDSTTQKKIESLLDSKNLEISGQVLIRGDGQRAIVEMGAVRWLTNEEMWKLMHPSSVSEAVECEGRTFALEPCPFCLSGTFQIRALGRVWGGMSYGPPSSYEVIHHCDPVAGQPSRAVVRVGRDLESAVKAWNQRA